MFKSDKTKNMQFQKISIPTLRKVNRNFNVGDLKELFFKVPKSDQKFWLSHQNGNYNFLF